VLLNSLIQEHQKPCLHAEPQPPAHPKPLSTSPRAAARSPPERQLPGACAADIRKHCDGVREGEGRLADCMGHLMQELDGDDDEKKEAEQQLSADCMEDVLRFRIDRNVNINKNIPLGASSVLCRWGNRVM